VERILHKLLHENTLYVKIAGFHTGMTKVVDYITVRFLTHAGLRGMYKGKLNIEINEWAVLWRPPYEGYVWVAVEVLSTKGLLSCVSLIFPRMVF